MADTQEKPAAPADDAVEVYEDGKDSVHILKDSSSAPSSSGSQSLEESQKEAYNPETGEINWDCPCLGPMVQPPCGDKFKAAFSCFVYSTEEPKGLDCIEQFREMQKCFQQYPEIYGEELSNADADADADAEKEKEKEKDEDDKKDE